MDTGQHPRQALLSVSFVYVPMSGSPKLSFHYPELSSDEVSSSGDRDEEPEFGDDRHVHSLPHAFFADFLSAKAALCDEVMDITIDGLRFIGYPLMLPSATSQGNDVAELDVKSFNVVFAVDRSKLLRNRGPFHIPTACARAAKVIGSAFRHEEMRCGYLSKQVGLFKATKKRRQDSSFAVHAHSNLALVLSHTFEALREATMTCVLVNDWLEVSLPPPYEPLEPLDRAPIRPYQTLLPTDPESSNIEGLLPRGASQAVHRLLREANPCKSFQDLEVELDIPLETLLRAAGYLIEWRFAIVIETISKHNVYVVAPDANIATESQLYNDFENFSGHVKERRWSLPGLLLQFSIPLSLDEHRSALGGSPKLVMEFIACLIWLIRSGLVIQLKRYVYVNLFDVAAEDRLSRLETPFGDRPDFPTFKRLCKYFDGTHHLEDIMWRENIPRESLTSIIESYGEVLTTCIHE